MTARRVCPPAPGPLEAYAADRAGTDLMAESDELTLDPTDDDPMRTQPNGHGTRSCFSSVKLSSQPARRILARQATAVIDGASDAALRAALLAIKQAGWDNASQAKPETVMPSPSMHARELDQAISPLPY